MVSPELSSLYLQLGVAGATLLILLVTIAYLFKFMGNYSKNNRKVEENKIEKLCDKIDNLISIIAEDRKVQAETRIANDKDQKSMIEIMANISMITNVIYEKVIKIDTRMEDKDNVRNIDGN
jgi:hypothetical protein